MKCMANQDESVVVRVSDEKALVLQEEGFHYVPKELWKEKTRDVEKPTEEKSTKTKNNKMSKSAKRHLRKQNKKK